MEKVFFHYNRRQNLRINQRELYRNYIKRQKILLKNFKLDFRKIISPKSIDEKTQHHVDYIKYKTKK